MNWNRHSTIEGQHAFLSASKYSWLNYSDEKIESAYKKMLAVQMGTRLHEFASECIKLKQKLPKSQKTLNMFVNDAIGYRMQSEQILYFSDNAFGTADAICFRNNKLRIHDLKTGEIPAHMQQLEIYAALFCLEYRVKPTEIEDFILQIYQSDEIMEHHPTSDDILNIMNKIVKFDEIINKVKGEL